MLVRALVIGVIGITGFAAVASDYRCVVEKEAHQGDYYKTKNIFDYVVYVEDQPNPYDSAMDIREFASPSARYADGDTAATGQDAFTLAKQFIASDSRCSQREILNCYFTMSQIDGGMISDVYEGGHSTKPVQQFYGDDLSGLDLLRDMTSHEVCKLSPARTCRVTIASVDSIVIFGLKQDRSDDTIHQVDAMMAESEGEGGKKINSLRQKLIAANVCTMPSRLPDCEIRQSAGGYKATSIYLDGEKAETFYGSDQAARADAEKVSFIKNSICVEKRGMVSEIWSNF